MTNTTDPNPYGDGITSLAHTLEHLERAAAALEAEPTKRSLAKYVHWQMRVTVLAVRKIHSIDVSLWELRAVLHGQGNTKWEPRK